MKNKTLFIITVFLLTISCANANLLINGFFEYGSVGTQFGASYPTGWTGSGWNGWHAGDAGRVHDGYGIVMWGNDTYIRQRVDATAGQSYTFSANMYHSDEWNVQIPDWDYPLVDQNAIVRITFYNSSGGTVGSSRYPATLTESHTTNTWHRFTDTFTVPATAVELEVRCYLQHTGSSPGGKAFWDDLELKPATPVFCPPQTDFDDDGIVQVSDLGLFCIDWLTSSNAYDMDGNDFLDLNDFTLFANEWMDTTIPAGYHIIWEDNFNGTTLDTANKWVYDTGNGVDGWGNWEQQYYTSRTDNVRLANGNLVIEAKEENYSGYSYTSGKIKTLGKYDNILYGRIEARIKIPAGGQGIWPAFWMMPTDAFYGPWPESGEIDVMESTNRRNQTFGTIHFGSNSPWNPQNNGDHYTNDPGPVDLDDDFHVYAVEWDTHEFKFYIDDILYHTVNNTAWWTPGYTGSGDTAPFDKEFYIIFNVAVGGAWPGNPDSTSVFPQQMLVDYVRVYDYIPL